MSSPEATPSPYEKRGVQQDDNYREFMRWITDGGLRYAYAKYNKSPDASEMYRKQVDDDERRHIIVVGAGASGLAAAYELAQIGHKVTILELQSRVGGRIKTFRDGFQDGLHCEGGAMRLPYNHFLTQHYIEHFGVETRNFQNYNDKGYIYVYGDKIRIKDWEEKNGYYSSKYWPGWDSNLTQKVKDDLKINGIDDYLEQTLKPVKDDLGKKPTEKKWREWITKWSRLSVEDFLRHSEHQPDDGPKLRPWPEAAIKAYKVSTYSPMLDQDLVSYLREDLGEWWKDPMYTPTFGMDQIPKAFAKKNVKGWNRDVDLSENIRFGFKVTEIKETKIDKTKTMVKVVGKNIVTGKGDLYEGDAVLLTVPLHILGEINIPLSIEKQQALASITYAPSTKVMMQCKTRFWQKDVGQGGFSKTNQQIGQIHYPDYDGSGIEDDKRGILVSYTWAENALTFGSQTHQQAIAKAVHQVSKIHPEIEQEFEVGNVQAWYSDPHAQGAFASLKPFEFINNMAILTTPTPTIYLAGEALSWSNGWIQGALFSGLMQAFCFQSYTEKRSTTTESRVCATNILKGTSAGTKVCMTADSSGASMVIQPVYLLDKKDCCD